MQGKPSQIYLNILRKHFEVVDDIVDDEVYLDSFFS